jgi:hypothetical protein
MKHLLTLLIAFVLLLGTNAATAQKPDLSTVISHKWRVIWFSDDGVEKNMEAKKQQMHLHADGKGEVYMLGQKVGDVTWTLADGKDMIRWADDPAAPEGYLVKVSKYKKGKNMLFTGTLPSGVVRKVYFEILSGK